MRNKLIELLAAASLNSAIRCSNTGCDECCENGGACFRGFEADHLIANGVTLQERAEWVHPKEYVVSNGFLCSKCGHEQVSYRPINPRPGGGCIADENGNFYYPPKLNYCPDCGAKMIPEPPQEDV